METNKSVRDFHFNLPVKITIEDPNEGRTISFYAHHLEKTTIENTRSDYLPFNNRADFRTGVYRSKTNSYSFTEISDEEYIST